MVAFFHTLRRKNLKVGGHPSRRGQARESFCVEGQLTPPSNATASPTSADCRLSDKSSTSKQAQPPLQFQRQPGSEDSIPLGPLFHSTSLGKSKACIHRCSRPFRRYILNIYSIPSTMLGNRNEIMKMMSSLPSWRPTFINRKTIQWEAE